MAQTSQKPTMCAYTSCIGACGWCVSGPEAFKLSTVGPELVLLRARTQVCQAGRVSMAAPGLCKLLRVDDTAGLKALRAIILAKAIVVLRGIRSVHRCCMNSSQKNNLDRS